MLGLPFIFPGKLEKLDESWHKGQGRLWIFGVIYTVIFILLVVLYAISTYSDSANSDTWIIKLIGAFFAAIVSFFVYIYISNKIYQTLLARLPKWVQKNQYADCIRWQKLVSANIRTIIYSLIVLLIGSGSLYLWNFLKVKYDLMNIFMQLSLFVIIFFMAFSSMTAILAVIFIILDKGLSTINKRVKKPLWSYILFLFFLGSIFEIVGVIISNPP
jgi:hypothetical protein